MTGCSFRKFAEIQAVNDTPAVAHTARFRKLAEFDVMLDDDLIKLTDIDTTHDNEFSKFALILANVNDDFSNFAESVLELMSRLVTRYDNFSKFDDALV